MRVIGITGGVGAGKSAILKYIAQNFKAEILLADEVAHIVKEPGEVCYEPLIKLLGEDVLEEREDLQEEKPQIDKKKMAEKIFADQEILQKVNELIHPAVKKYIVDAIETAIKEGEKDYFFVEAALLIEDHYDEIVDEMWYIRADPAIRRERLKETRGYSDEKIDAIMATQLSEEEYIAHCKHIIDNSTTKEDAYLQIEKALT